MNERSKYEVVLQVIPVEIEEALTALKEVGKRNPEVGAPHTAFWWGWTLALLEEIRAQAHSSETAWTDLEQSCEEGAAR